MSFRRHYFLNLSAQTLGRFINTAGNFIIFFMVARVLGAEQFGQYSYILTFLGLAVLVAEFGTNGVLAKQIVEFKDESRVYWGNFLMFRFCSSILVTILAIVVAYFIRFDLFDSLLMGSACIIFISSRFFEPVFQVHQKPWYSLYPTVVFFLVYTVSSLTVLYLYESLFLIIVVYSLTNAIYILVAGYLSTRVITPVFKFNAKHMKKLASLALPAGLSNLFILVHMRADIFMLAVMKTDYEVGIYNAAYKFLDIATIFAVVISTPILPILSKYALDNRDLLRSRYMQFIELIAIVTLPVAIITPLISPLVVTVLFGTDYLPSAAVINVIVWIGVIVVYSVFLSTVLMAVERIHHMVWLGAVSACLNVLFNLWAIEHFSYMGAAWVTLVVEIFLISVTIYYIKNVLGCVARWKVWGKILVANGLLAVASLIPLPPYLQLIVLPVVYLCGLFVLRVVTVEHVTSMRLFSEG
ncbi:MAG: flippase [Desulfobulbaceae bacterium]|nr:MAG: flippase [Desulfobulbaceae bacterium]